jgi:hypothetical protein
MNKEAIKQLKKKYGYSDDLIVKLNQLFVATAKLYGSKHKEIILQTILNCPIYKLKDDEDFLTIPFKEYEESLAYYNLINNKKTQFNTDILNITAGAYYSYPMFEFKNNKVYLKDFCQYILVSPTFNPNDITSLAILAHELFGHAVRAQYSTRYIVNNVYVQRIGNYKKEVAVNYNKKSRKFEVKIVAEKGLGLEEMISYYFEYEILHKAGYTEYNPTKISNFVAPYLMYLFENAEIGPKIIDGLINPESVDIEKEYNEQFSNTTENKWELLNQKMDYFLKRWYTYEKERIVTNDHDHKRLNELKKMGLKIRNMLKQKT